MKWSPDEIVQAPPEQLPLSPALFLLPSSLAPVTFSYASVFIVVGDAGSSGGLRTPTVEG